MPVYKLGNLVPRIATTAYLTPNCTVLGNVSVGENASVWFGATVRGDNELIDIGAGVNIQDGAVLHTDPGFPMTLGANASIGHQAMLHGCKVGEGSLVGIQAVIMNGAVIGKGCLIGACALITEGKVFPDNTLIIGAPAKVSRELSPDEQAALKMNAKNYQERAAYYRIHLLPSA